MQCSKPAQMQTAKHKYNCRLIIRRLTIWRTKLPALPRSLRPQGTTETPVAQPSSTKTKYTVLLWTLTTTAPAPLSLPSCILSSLLLPLTRKTRLLGPSKRVIGIDTVLRRPFITTVSPQRQGILIINTQPISIRMYLLLQREYHIHVGTPMQSPNHPKQREVEDQ